MASSLTRQLAQLPAGVGLYLLLNARGQALRLGLAENLRAELTQQTFVPKTKLEAFVVNDLAELPALYQHLWHEHQPQQNPPPIDAPNYPYLSLTTETFPRLQVIRRAGGEIYGPVLPAHALPDAMERLAKHFRLRRCHETIDGSWPLPCLEFFRKRCLAPCVRELCDAPSYQAAVTELRSFLKNDGAWEQTLQTQMTDAVAHEDFEAAAQTRDALAALQQLRANDEFVIGAAELTDVFTLHDTDDGSITLHLLTRRERKKYGELLFRWDDSQGLSAAQLLEDLLLWRYAGELPREIKLPLRLPHQKLMQRIFQSLGSELVVAAKPVGVMAHFAAQRALIKQTVRTPAPQTNAETELQHALKLAAPPACVQCYDVAHLAGSHTVASVVTWRADAPDALSQQIHLLDGFSEPDAMHEAVRRSSSTADLILVDGGKTQLRRAQAAAHAPVIAAVKPPGQSHLISHLLAPDESALTLDPASPAARLLHRLRDAAHYAANTAHRQWREANQLPELTRLLPELTESQRKALLQQCDNLKNILNASLADLRKTLDEPQAQLTAQRLKRLRQLRKSSTEQFLQLPVVNLMGDWR